MDEFEVKKAYNIEHCDGWGVIVRNYNSTDPELTLKNHITLTSYHETKDGIVEDPKSTITLWGDGPYKLINVLNRMMS